MRSWYARRPLLYRYEQEIQGALFDSNGVELVQGIPTAV